MGFFREKLNQLMGPEGDRPDTSFIFSRQMDWPTEALKRAMWLMGMSEGLREERAGPHKLLYDFEGEMFQLASNAQEYMYKTLNEREKSRIETEIKRNIDKGLFLLELMMPEREAERGGLYVLTTDGAHELQELQAMIPLW